jgi:hypothetical protein
LHEVSTQYIRGSEQTRWHEAAAYRTEGGKYVVAIAYVTRWAGESDHRCAAVAETPRKLVDFIGGYDPTQYVVGYPVNAAPEGKDPYAEKQRRLLQSLRLNWESAVSELYSRLDPEEFADSIA